MSLALRLPSRLVLASVLLLLSCGSSPRRGSGGVASAPARQRSNILRSDYAGSAACARCHAEIYTRWQRSPMHNMTRLPDRAQIAAPFADSVFRFKDDRVVLTQQGGTRFLRIESPKFGDHLFRITKVIGGHHREDFAGLEIARPAPDAPIIGDAHDERVLPVSYVLASKSFRYKGYSVMLPERSGLRRGAVWNRTCIFCHNTVPFFSTILGTLAGPGTPAYQGAVVDSLLPAERKLEWTITDEPALRQALHDEIAYLRGRDPTSGMVAAMDEKPVRDVLRQGVAYTRTLFKESHLVEVGIGCESCHLGSKDHVQDSRLLPSYAPRSPFLKTRPDGQSRGQQINRLCARCHQVLFSQYPHTWEGGTRRGNPGGSNINSGEARDLLLSSCGSQLGCVACHDPHAPGDENQRHMAELETSGGNAICLRCHEKYREPQALRDHAHHDPNGAGGQCMNCHMPKKNMSLDNKLSRYHRIGSPTDRTRVLNDRPLECALCHADRSTESLLADMERMYGKKYDRGELAVLYGDLRDNNLVSTLQRGRPHEQAVAIAVLGREKRKDTAPLIAQQLTHPLPIVRYYAASALEQILGSASPVELHQDNARIEAEAQKWLLGSGLQMPTKSSGAPASSAGAGSDEE